MSVVNTYIGNALALSWTSVISFVQSFSNNFFWCSSSSRCFANRRWMRPPKLRQYLISLPVSLSNILNSLSCCWKSVEKRRLLLGQGIMVHSWRIRSIQKGRMSESKWMPSAPPENSQPNAEFWKFNNGKFQQRAVLYVYVVRSCICRNERVGKDNDFSVLNFNL